MSYPYHRRFRMKPGMTKYGKRHVPGQMNKTESEYAERLNARMLAGEILTFEFEAVKLKLADLCFYTPDFYVLNTDGTLEFIDVKGGGPIDDKSIVKVKCAAEKFWQFTFAIEQKQSKKNGGHWKRTEY